MIKPTKAKFKGQPNQRFQIGIHAFPSGIWVSISLEEIKIIVAIAGYEKDWEFSPPISNDLLLEIQGQQPTGKKTITKKKSKKEDSQ